MKWKESFGTEERVCCAQQKINVTLVFTNDFTLTKKEADELNDALSKSVYLNLCGEPSDFELEYGGFFEGTVFSDYELDAYFSARIDGICRYYPEVPYLPNGDYGYQEEFDVNFSEGITKLNIENALKDLITRFPTLPLGVNECSYYVEELDEGDFDYD